MITHYHYSSALLHTVIEEQTLQSPKELHLSFWYFVYSSIMFYNRYTMLDEDARILCSNFAVQVFIFKTHAVWDNIILMFCTYSLACVGIQTQSLFLAVSECVSNFWEKPNISLIPNPQPAWNLIPGSEQPNALSSPSYPVRTLCPFKERNTRMHSHTDTHSVHLPARYRIPDKP